MGASLPAVARYTGDDRLVAATRSTSRPSISVRRPGEVVVVLGRGSDPAVELNLESCLADGVPIVRRSGGGCSVVLDPGNLVVAVALPVRGLGRIKAHFDSLTSWLIEALARTGTPGVERAGLSDLVLRDRKIGGSCIARSRGLLLFSSTILVAPRVELMERYLAHPPREPAYRRGRGHADFVGSTGGDPVRLAARLERTLALSDL